MTATTEKRLKPDVASMLRRLRPIIISHVEKHGYQPSFAELAKKLGTSTSTVTRVVHLGIASGILGTDKLDGGQLASRAICIPGIRYKAIKTRGETSNGEGSPEPGQTG